MNLPKLLKKLFFSFLLILSYVCANLAVASTCEFSQVLSESAKIVQINFFLLFLNTRHRGHNMFAR